MSKTPNYQLHRWEPHEPVRRAELNDSMTKLDAALTTKANTTELNTKISTVNSSINSIQTLLNEKARIVTGRYTGNGEASRTISLSFIPAAILVEARNGLRTAGYGGLALSSSTAATSAGKNIVSIVGSSFQVYYESNVVMSNSKNTTYNYIAFK